MLETCLSLRRSIGNPMEIAATLSTLSAVRLRLGDAGRARQGETEALAIFRQLGKRSEEAIVLLHLGEICVYTGDDDEARGFLEQSLAIAREIKYQETVSDCERTLGQVALEQADLAAARTRFERALAVCQSAGDRRGAASALWWLGKVDFADGDAASAQRRLGEALRCFQTFEMRAEMVGCIEDHGQVALSLGLADEAARLYAAVATIRENLALPRLPRSEQRWTNELEATRLALGARFESAWAEGREWSLKTAVSHALAATRKAAASARSAEHDAR
jgi:tetratricopeptide (TPR) repeat protein